MIRLAKVCDLDGVMNCINDAKNLFKKDNSDQWQDLDNYPNENTMLSDINNNELYVYEENNIILGCIVLSNKNEVCYDNMTVGSWLTNGKYMVIHRLAINKDYYRKGIANELIKHTIDIAKNNNAVSIKVDTKIENIRMQNLLYKCNFKKVGIIYLLRTDVLDKERVAFELVL